MAFVCDMGDLFHDAVPDSILWDFFYLVMERMGVIWQVLTKRPQRMRQIAEQWLDWLGPAKELPQNLWLGVSVENQRTADERIPLLLETPAAVRFVSAEPLLAPVDFAPFLDDLSLIICGAESGPRRRHFDVAWAEDLYEQCKAANVPFWGKQDSGLRPGVPLLIHGKEVKQWPES